MQPVKNEVQPSSLDSMQEQLQSNLELQQLLETLPDKVRHSIMVPFGSVAFFPGNLLHTNECFVDLGTSTRRYSLLTSVPNSSCARLCGWAV